VPDLIAAASNAQSTVTYFAATDDAFVKAAERLGVAGGVDGFFAADDAARALLSDIVRHHVVWGGNRVPVRLGSAYTTYNGTSPIFVKYSVGGGGESGASGAAVVQAVGGEARVLSGAIGGADGGCNAGSSVVVIDAVLLPFVPPPTSPTAAPAKMPAVTAAGNGARDL
jgi:hypothetical protein